MRQLTRRTFFGLTAALAALAVILPQGARAQSISKAKPTPLLSREIKGRADYAVPSSGWAKTFYYSFEAGPGEVVVTVNTAPGVSGAGVFYNITFEADGKPLPRVLGLIAAGATEGRRQTRSLSLPRRTRVLMAVRLSGSFDYRITFGGAVAKPPAALPPGGEVVATSPEHDNRTKDDPSEPYPGPDDTGYGERTEDYGPPNEATEAGQRAIAEERRRLSPFKNRPAAVIGREIRERANYPVPSSGYARTFYYTFEAGPGEVEVTVVSRPRPGGKGVFLNITFEADGRPLPQVLGLIAAGATDERTVSKSITLSKRTRVLMAVGVSGSFDYTIKLDGVVAPDM